MKPRPTGLRPYAKTVSLAELARRWGATRREVRRLAASGWLPFVQVGGRIRIPERATRRLPNPFAG
jgi:excisionase family DNA binding protein